MDADILRKIRQSFNHVPKEDPRSKIGPLDFLVSLIFCLSPDSKRKSIDGLRREMMAKTNVALSRSSFWERLATDRLRRFLVTALGNLMKSFSYRFGINHELLDLFKVKSIYLIDACSISLPYEAKSEYPAPRKNVVPSAIKWHVCMDLVSGSMPWYSLTPAKDHDRNHFPPLSLLKGTLVIFDLGYWDYQLLADLIANSCLFLCRMKKNAVIEIVGVSEGGPKNKLLGHNLFNFNWTRKRQDIIELLGSFSLNKEEFFEARVIGFWNPANSSYHWYVTNLSIPAKCIYPAYRLRWQVELLFKSAKGSLRLEDIPSSNSNIIWSLVLSTLIANLITQPLVRSLIEDEKSLEKKNSQSIQRAAMLLSHLAYDFRYYIVEHSKSALMQLKKKIKLYYNELFDPNYRKRKSTIQQVITAAKP